MDLKSLQSQIHEWIIEHDDYWDEFAILARLTEELGEMASALQRIKGLRPVKKEVDLPGEVGDLLFTLIAFANKMDIDLETEMERTISKYNIRDSEAWKKKNKR